MWYEQFEEMDRPFMEKEAQRNSMLAAWRRHRRGLDAAQCQDRLHTGHFYTDDFSAAVLEPPHHSRIKTAVTAWHMVTSRLGIRTARPEKRMVGATIPWTGVVMIACLALQVLQQSKVTKAYAWLAIAASGTMIYDDCTKRLRTLTPSERK
jgi:hypothetical protein